MQLTAEQKLLGRRNFLKAAAVLPAAGAVTLKAAGTGPVRTGYAGTGMQGRILIGVTDAKYLRIEAMCDIRPDNRKHGKWAICNPERGHNPNPKVYDHYEDMLNDSSLEAIIIATPLSQHGPMTIQALKAGKHVFTEKTMAYSMEECAEMVRLAEKNNLILQVGHQRFYNPLYWDAYKMIRENLLGNVYHIRALWHRNTDWNYWTHVWDASNSELQQELFSMDPKPYGYPDVQRLVNWRWYREMSHGLWTELCSHQIAITNWIFDSVPTAVYASGGKYKTKEDQDDLYVKYKDEYAVKQKYNDNGGAKTFDDYRTAKQRYHTDDRTIADHIYAIYEYPDNRTVTYSAIQSSRVDNYYEEIMGTRGTIVLCNENESYLFWEPDWDEDKSRKAAEAEKQTRVEVTSEDAAASAFAAHVSEKATGSGGASDMSQLDPYKWELQGFAHSIRTGAPNLCDGRRGAMAAYACLQSQQSMESKKRIEIPPYTI